MKKKIRSFELIVSSSLFLLSLLLFFPARQAGMVHDFTGFFINMEQATWSEAINSFGYQVVQPFLQSFNLALFHLAGRNSVFYFLTFHLLFAFGIFSWALFLQKFNLSKLSTVVILLGFTLNPYIAEVLIYDVCQSYLWTFIFLGFYHYFLLGYLASRNPKLLIALAICLLLQLWTFDFIVIYFPLTLLVLLTVQRPVHRKASATLILINILVLALYFIQNKWFLGSFVGHYGPDVHFVLEVKSQLATMVKYFMKQVGFGQFYSYSVRSNLYRLSESWIVISLFLFMSMLALYTLSISRKHSIKGYSTISYFFLAGIVTLLPVSNLSFPELMLTENDRYGFLFCFFITATLTLIILKVRNRVVKILLCILFIGALFLGQRKLIKTWSVSEEIVAAALQNWPAEFYDKEDKILLLNLPDNYHGAYLFKNLNKESKLFQETYYSTISDTTFALFQVVAQMNMDKKTDGARAESVGVDTVRVDLNQYGTWWWRNGLGAYSYENKDYRMDLNGLGYTVQLKDSTSKCFIWDNLAWRRVNIRLSR